MLKAHIKRVGMAATQVKHSLTMVKRLRLLHYSIPIGRNGLKVYAGDVFSVTLTEMLLVF